MKRKYVLLSSVSVLVFAVLLALPVLAVAPTSSPLLERLSAKYHRINLFPTGSEKVISESETTFVMHGWNSAPGPEVPDYPYWSEMSGKDKNEFLKTASFELYVGDGDPVKLHRNQWYDHVNDIMYVYYYVVFPSYTFEVGTYEFRGEWNLDFYGNPYHYTSTVSVNVNPSS